MNASGSDVQVSNPSESPAKKSETVTLTVNGTAYEVAADPDTLLLYVLRDDLGLTGTLYGCGSGLCGACFVLVDNYPTPSCDTPLWAVTDSSIITVEGLSEGELSPVQEAFVEARAGQCGYCLSGILVSVSSLHRREGTVTEAELLEYLDRHLCRCGGQNQILDAARQALGIDDG